MHCFRALRLSAAVLVVLVVQLWLTSQVSAQPFIQHLRGPLFVHPPDTLLNPFSGGIDRPAFQCVDIDGDGDLDLFLLDRDQRLALYRNRGNVNVPSFVLETLSFQNLSVGSWFRFADIDGDGDQDLFCNGPSATVRFFRNVGTPAAPSFYREIETLLDSSGTVVLSEDISHPAFADLDGDGDLDFFSGNSVGAIWYYENVGTPAKFLFKFRTDEFQGIRIIGGGGSTKNPDPPRGVPADEMAAERNLHGAMAIDVADIDGDGDLDLFWGDFFNPSLYFLRNNGTPTNPQIALVDSTFPDEVPVLSGGFNMPGLVDIDGDGDLDMLIAVLYIGTSFNNFRFYRNDGTNTAHDFNLITNNFLPTVDAGAASTPVLADVDRDGTPDLVIGSEAGGLVWYKRTGPASSPVFERRAGTLANLTGLFDVSPSFGDLDGDGKPDLIVGDFNGKLRLHRGTDTSFASTAFQLDSVSFGLDAAPVLVDINGDSLLDLFVGTGGGRIQFFLNSGSRSVPNFVLQSNFFPSIDVGDNAKPTFADMDGDGDLDFIIGASSGGLTYYRNDGWGSNPIFTLVPNFFSGVTAVLRSAPACVDIDGDGDMDILLGNLKGGVYFYENELNNPVPPVQQAFQLFQNYPNPFNLATSIRYDLAAPGYVTVRIYNILGEMVTELVRGEDDPGPHQVAWEAKNLPSGMYLCRLSVGAFSETRKMLLLK